MDMNRIVGDWALAQLDVRKIAAALEAGDYYEWKDDDDEGPSEQVTAELRRELGKRGLELYSDDRGMGVTVALWDRSPHRIPIVWAGYVMVPSRGAYCALEGCANAPELDSNICSNHGGHHHKMAARVG